MSELAVPLRTDHRTGSFRIMVSRYAPDLRIDRHEHENASLCLALSGAYEEFLDRKSRRVEAGTLVYHPEGEAHANRHLRAVTDLVTIELEASASKLANPLSPIFDDGWHGKRPRLLPTMYRLIQTIETEPASPGLVIDDLVWEVIGEVADHLHDDGRPKWLCEVRDYLEAGFATPPSLTELADMAGVHPAHLTRAFRMAFGSSIGVFIQRRQAAEALRLLPRLDLSLADISGRAGFSDQSHMTRRITAATGRPPGAWRRDTAWEKHALQ